MVKTSKEKQATFRARMKKAGLVRRELWLYEEDWEEIKAFAEFKTRTTEAKKEKK